jgi:hypothetical protein
VTGAVDGGLPSHAPSGASLTMDGWMDGVEAEGMAASCRYALSSYRYAVWPKAATIRPTWPLICAYEVA